MWTLITELVAGIMAMVILGGLALMVLVLFMERNCDAEVDNDDLD